jgi:nitrous oxidase accessory protein NosD
MNAAPFGLKCVKTEPEATIMAGVTGCVTRGLAIAVMAATGLAGLSQTAAAAVRRVPGSYPTIQAAVDAASAGDVIHVAPGRHCGARIDRPVTLLGHGRATIVGCADGPALSNGVRAGFLLPGADGASGASGTHIEGFVFDGRGIAADNLEPLGVAIIATFASHVRVEHNLILGTVQGITNTAGDRWTIAHNVIRDLTVFDCTGALCGGGDGIVIQIARDPTAVPGGPEAAGNRPKDNVIVGNVIEGAIPDGFDAFSMAGVFVFAADRTVVARNRLSLPDNPNADAEGIGVLVDNSCCGLPAVVPGARNTVVVFNDGRDSQRAVEIDGTGGENTQGLVLFGNAGTVLVEGTVVEGRTPRHRRPGHAGRFRHCSLH